MSENEIMVKVRLYKELQQVIAEAEAEAEALRADITAFMGDREQMRAGLFNISWKPVKSARLDTKALKKAMPELAAAFTREITTRRFVVS